MAETLLLVSSGVQAIGTLVDGYAQQQAGKAEAASLNDSARQTGRLAAANEGTIRNSNRRLQGEQLAAIGANGVTLSGSALDFTLDQAVEMEMEALKARYEGADQARGLRNEARAAKHRGKQAFAGSIISAGAQAVSGYAKYSGGSGRSTPGG